MVIYKKKKKKKKKTGNKILWKGGAISPLFQDIFNTLACRYLKHSGPSESNCWFSFSFASVFSYFLLSSPHCCYAPAIFNGDAYSITAVCTYVRPVRPVRNINGFHAISFENIGILD